MQDGFFFLGILVLFFLMWAFSGGPSRPISFAGPYITPITNEGQVQTGYGPKLNVTSTIRLPGATVSTSERTSAVTNTSSYASVVTLSHIAGDTASPTGYAQIDISSSAGKDVDITGWKLTSTSLNNPATIPTGILLMRLGTANTLEEINLKPGDHAVIAPGASPVNASFEGNQCSGYLTKQQSSYNSCVTAHVNGSGFLLGIWYVYLGKTSAVWANSGDTMELLDNDGKVVGSYSY